MILKKNIYKAYYRENSPTMDRNDLSYNVKNIVLSDRVRISGMNGIRSDGGKKKKLIRSTFTGGRMTFGCIDIKKK